MIGCYAVTELSIVRFERETTTLWRSVDGAVLLLPSGSTEAWLVTAPGEAIWNLLGAPRSIDEMAEALAEQFGESPHRIATDIDPIIAVLEEIGAAFRVEVSA